MCTTPSAASLYVPRFNVMDPDEVRPFVDAVATAQLVTVGEDGVPDATFLPVLWEGDRLVGHLARANGHWRRIVDGSPGAGDRHRPGHLRLAVLVRHEGRARQGRPDVELLGRPPPRPGHGARRRRVGARPGHPADRPPRAAASGAVGVTDAPDDYVDKNLRPIVGVEIVVDSVEAKAKLSQNRSDEDRAGVATGLAADGREPDGLVAP